MTPTKKTKKKVVLETLGVTPKDMLIACLMKWPWFILSIIVCVGVGLLFLLRTPPVYQRNTKLLIKTDVGSVSTEAQALGSMEGLSNMFLVNNKLQDELITLKSPMTIEEVVSRLRLNTMYSTRKYLRDYTLYAEEVPVNIIFLDLDDNKQSSFKFSLENTKFTISNLTGYNVEDEGETTYTGNLNDTIKTSIGRLIVKPSVYNQNKTTSFDCLVTHYPLRSVAEHYRSNLYVEGGLNGSSQVEIVIRDTRAPRADEFLNTLI